MGRMKGQVLPEELLCLGTEWDCGCAVNRTVKVDRVEKESKNLSKNTYATKTTMRKALHFIFQLIDG